MRIREVWIHAVDLDNGAQFADFPEPVLERLHREILETWQQRGHDCSIPAGGFAELVQWMSGRGGPLAGQVGEPPRWL